MRQTDLISIDALILLALVQCSGSYAQKAEVFYRVISPDMQGTISVTDKDLKMALTFLINISTIFEEMTREMMKQPQMGMNYEIYQQKIRRYKPTYDGMLEDFYDSNFGEYNNRSSRE